MALISVCIPVYNGKEYIKECLETVYNQTYKYIQVLISLDCCTDSTIDICSKLKKKYRDIPTIIYLQEKNLGWVKNCNFLIKKSSGEYFSILPHDDYIPENYLEELLKGFALYPNAVNCYPYIICKGQVTQKCDRFYQNSLVGDTQSRVINIVDNYISAVSFRGLVKRNLPDNLLYLREDIIDNIMADTIWIMQHAVAGELYQMNVPYYKTFHGQNEHKKWNRVDMEKKKSVWVQHCGLLYEIGSEKLDDKGKLKLKDYCIKRLYVEKDSAKFWYLPRHRISNDMLDSFNKYTQKARVAVLGAGIQGCCVALLLLKQGYDVTMIDKAQDIMSRTSLNQEGKIHMGFVYSNDKSMETGRRMMTSALHFSYYMEQLLDETVDWEMLKSIDFRYIVPFDSLVPGNELEKFFDRLQKIYCELLAEKPYLSYLNKKPQTIFKRVPVPRDVDNTFFTDCFETVETSISQKRLKKIIKDKLVQKGITLRLGEEVVGIDGECGVTTSNGNYRFDAVFNCMWENQKKFDSMLGFDRADNQNLRLKFGIKTDHVASLAEFPSTTIVNGPYGDYVYFPRDNYMYFSWYPISMYGMVVGTDLPKEWEKICAGDIDNELIEHQINSQLEMFGKLFGREIEAPKATLVAGIIVAKGVTDIGDKESMLHKRDENPIFRRGNYFSISTGKFTFAPYNTFLLESNLCENPLVKTI